MGLLNWQKLSTTWGPMHAAEANDQLISLCISEDNEVNFLKSLQKDFPQHTIQNARSSVFFLLEKQLDEFFNQDRTQLDIPFKMHGTDFQKNVWNALLQIPYGHTQSYQDIAISIHKPKAVRAVGGANHKNRLPLLIPCHRVIGKNNSLTGFNGGLELKAKLLTLEKSLAL